MFCTSLLLAWILIRNGIILIFEIYMSICNVLFYDNYIEIIFLQYKVITDNLSEKTDIVKEN